MRAIGRLSGQAAGPGARASWPALPGEAGRLAKQLDHGHLHRGHVGLATHAAIDGSHARLHGFTHRWFWVSTEEQGERSPRAEAQGGLHGPGSPREPRVTPPPGGGAVLPSQGRQELRSLYTLRRSLARREMAPVARGSRNSHDADRLHIRSVSDERGSRGPEPIGRRPEVGTVAPHLRHAREEVERAQEISVDALGHEPPVALLDFEEYVFEISLGRSGELESRSHSPLRRRSSIRRRTSAIASSLSRSSPRSSAATPSAI